MREIVSHYLNHEFSRRGFMNRLLGLGFSLAGADSFLSLPRWRDPGRLLELAEWIVVSRPGYPFDGLAGLGLTPDQCARVHMLETVHYDIAATSVRERLRKGEPCTELLLPAIADYIQAHRLYR